MDLNNVYAPESGIIYLYEYASKSSYGNMAIINHGNCLYSLLGHLKSFNNVLKNGDKIQKNMFIGLIGNTSIYKNMTKHLHWGVFDHITQGIFNKNENALSIFHGPNYFVNKKSAIDPEIMIEKGWIYPCFGKITSSYGERNPPPYNNEKFRYHYGIDFSCKTYRDK